MSSRHIELDHEVIKKESQRERDQLECLKNMIKK